MRLLLRLGATLLTVSSLSILTGCVFLYQMPKGPELTVKSPLEAGLDSFVMTAYRNTDRVSIKIHTYLPKDWQDGDDILFVMHGAGRNADDYLNAWIDYADANTTLLVAPEFASRFARYITNDYQEGNLFTFFGSRNPRQEWAFTVIENTFDYLIEQNALSNDSYNLFGHSAGAQFIQRMVMLMPEARINHAVAANAGTYTFPDSNVDYPYGLGNLQADDLKLQNSFGTKLTILLGELDNTADQGILDQSDRAMAQGDHRLARGQNLYISAKRVADASDLSFAWGLHTVPDVGHDFRRMSMAAQGFFD